MLIEGIDPTSNAGHCVLDDSHCPPKILYLGTDPASCYMAVDIAVTETQFTHGKAGKKSLITMGTDTGFRLAQAVADKYYRFEPDAWRALIWGDRANGKPKTWVVHWLKKRLKEDHNLPDSLLDDLTDDAVESYGVALAMVNALQSKKALSKIAGLRRVQLKLRGRRWV